MQMNFQRGASERYVKQEDSEYRKILTVEREAGHRPALQLDEASRDARLLLEIR